MAATADEALYEYEPSSKLLKAESPGEACISPSKRYTFLLEFGEYYLLSHSFSNIESEASEQSDGICYFDLLPVELLTKVSLFLI
jgi:hypothetical protein